MGLFEFVGYTDVVWEGRPALAVATPGFCFRSSLEVGWDVCGLCVCVCVGWGRPVDGGERGEMSFFVCVFCFCFQSEALFLELCEKIVFLLVRGIGCTSVFRLCVSVLSILCAISVKKRRAGMRVCVCLSLIHI